MLAALSSACGSGGAVSPGGTGGATASGGVAGTSTSSEPGGSGQGGLGAGGALGAAGAGGLGIAGAGGTANLGGESLGGGAGAGSAAGSGGTGSTPTPSVVSGFASTASSGLATTTGGGTAPADTVVSCAELDEYLSDARARVIEIPAGTTLDCRTAPRTQQACELQCSAAAATPVYWRVPVGEFTCTSLADTNGDGTLDVPAGKLVSKVRREISIKVGSNKTLRGLGSGATLLGVSLDIENQSNIIIQNLKLSEVNPDLVEAGDGITINGSHHVWVDHCELSMISDGYLDIRYGSSAVTVSHSHINGRNQYVCGGQHHYISLVSDSQVTFSHDYFDHPSGRNPKVSGASQVHIHSSYYAGISYFGASAGAGAEVLVEGNYYLDTRYPHWADGGSIEASGNQYAGKTSTDHRDDNADVFEPPYEYELYPVSSLPESIVASAGPGRQ